MTHRTGPQGDAGEDFVSIAMVRRDGGRRSLGRRAAEERSAPGARGLPVAIAEHAVVPNAGEAGREPVEENPAHALGRGERQGFRGGVIVSIILGAEGALSLVHVHEAGIRDREAVRVPTDVVEDLRWAGDGGLA